MPKKKEADVASTGPALKVVFSEKVLPLGLDLGREDLNALVAKVNELVERVNNA